MKSFGAKNETLDFVSQMNSFCESVHTGYVKHCRLKFSTKLNNHAPNHSLYFSSRVLWIL